MVLTIAHTVTRLSGASGEWLNIWHIMKARTDTGVRRAVKASSTSTILKVTWTNTWTTSPTSASSVRGASLTNSRYDLISRSVNSETNCTRPPINYPWLLTILSQGVFISGHSYQRPSTIQSHYDLISRSVNSGHSYRRPSTIYPRSLQSHPKECYYLQPTGSTI